MVKPNAGIPRLNEAGETVYDNTPENFAKETELLVNAGATILGGCCGTTPEHIKAMASACKGMQILKPTKKNHTFVSSYGKTVEIGDKPVIIGERINPTGKSKFKQALKEHDIDYILREAYTQQEKGAHILDVNVDKIFAFTPAS